jgi:hypothetical protein
MNITRLLWLLFVCNAPTTAQAIELTIDELDYFVELACHQEYGSAKNITKWNDEIRIDVHGFPNKKDKLTLQNVICEIDSLTGDDLTIAINKNKSNLEICFYPHEFFNFIESHYVPGNLGYFYIYWNDQGEITKGKILISTNKLKQIERNHIIREELTQSLGLLNDLNKYSDSIFYQDWTTTQTYSDIDKLMIQLLYQPFIKPNMTQQEIYDLFRSEE